MPQINAPAPQTTLHTPVEMAPNQTGPSASQEQGATTTVAVPQIEVHMNPSPLGSLGLWISIIAIGAGIALAVSFQNSSLRARRAADLNALNERIRAESRR